MSDRKQLVAELKRQPGFDALRAWAHEIRDAYFLNLAKALFNGESVTAEDLAYKRGYFKGINRALNEVEFSAKAVEADLQRSEVNELD